MSAFGSVHPLATAAVGASGVVAVVDAPVAVVDGVVDALVFVESSPPPPQAATPTAMAAATAPTPSPRMAPLLLLTGQTESGLVLTALAPFWTSRARPTRSPAPIQHSSA
jgi:hypothetical protein